MSLAVYLILMAGVTYLIRMVPFTFFRRKIRSRFIKSFLYYVPFAVLSAMTFPAIFYSTGNVPTALCGMTAALALSVWKKPMIVVALAAAAVALATSFLF